MTLLLVFCELLIYNNSVISLRNLFLGYYLPFRHAVPLWEMENDYYLHNFHVLNAKNAACLMKTHEHEFDVSRLDEDEASDRESAVKVKMDLTNLNSNCVTGIDIRCIGYDRESERVARVRNRCNKQNIVLSSWWKSALQAHLRDRIWINLRDRYEGQLLPDRFERVYQPEKLGQFDRVFLRPWEVPVRRTHAAQHSAGVGDDDANDLSRIVSIDFFSLNRSDDQQCGTLNCVDNIPLHQFLKSREFDSRGESELESFVQPFNVDLHINALGKSSINPPDDFLIYCKPSSRLFLPPLLERVEEFNNELLDFSLVSDDVAGIDEVRGLSTSLLDIFLYLTCVTLACSIKSSWRIFVLR